MSTTEATAKPSGSGILSFVVMLIEAFVVAAIVQMFVVQTFDIPSGSMQPTIEIGDHVFVDKFAYGFSRYSFSYKVPGLNNGLIAFNGRIWSADPKRGDIVVFRKPGDQDTDYIKRVVGLPGDKIQMRAGVLLINGTAVSRTLDKAYDAIDAAGVHHTGKQYTETLPNGVSYHVLKTTDDGPANNTSVFEVPAGHFFMMGDNRDDSADSRFLSDVGYVPAENLIGRAWMIYFSHSGTSPVWQVWDWSKTVRLDRMFKPM